MEECNTNQIFSLLVNGCELAKKLEADLCNNLLVTASASAGSPLIISKRCDEIIKVFSMAKEQLNSMHPPPLDHHHHLHHHHHHHNHPEMAVDVEYEQHQGKWKGKDVGEVSMKVAASDREEKQHGMMMEVGGSSSSAYQQKTPRRSSRNGDQESNQRMKIPAPQIGNTEMPPDDGFTWRKYGQKEILNARFPRSYYRCTHQKLYNCPAKKQVQRLDEDPNTFEILYRGKHTCHMSNTAPSGPPPSSQAIQDIFTPHQQISTVASPLHHWLTVDLTVPSSEGACTIFHPQQQQQQPLYHVNNNSSVLCNNNNNNDTEVGPSTVRSHQEGDPSVELINNQPLLVDWTQMFTSGSSGSNSMEVIFPTSADDIKWGDKDIKN